MLKPTCVVRAWGIVALLSSGCLPRFIDEDAGETSIFFDAAPPPIEDAAPPPIEDAAPPPTQIDWIALEGGDFHMGSNDGGSDELPIHEVNIPAFEMSKSEVTVSEYRRCVQAGVCTEPGSGGSCNWSQAGREQHPINCVDWSQARAFAAWAEGRLPSEAEWEYAARSQGLDRVYPWGDEAATCERAVMDDGGDGCGEGRTWPVCSKPAGDSVQGLCDMSGNVWEWVEDCYEDTYDGAPVNGSSRDECSGSDRVFRGGSWYYNSDYLRAAIRYGNSPVLRFHSLGFRLARSSP